MKISLYKCDRCGKEIKSPSQILDTLNNNSAYS